MGPLRSAIHRIIKSATGLGSLGLLLVVAAQSPTAVLRAQNPQPSPLVEANCLGFGAARAERQALTGAVRFIGTEAGRPILNPGGASTSPLLAARSYLSACGSLFGLDQPDRDLQAIDVRALDTGRSVVRFRQTHQGIPVIAGELLVHVDGQRNILAVAGETLPQPAVATTPAIIAGQASSAAIEVIAKTYSLDPATLRTSTPELSIYSPTLLGPGTGPASLVWRMDVTPQVLGPIRELVLIDAERGSVRLHFNQIHTALNRQTYTAGNSTSLPGALVCNEANPACSGGDSHAIGAHLGAGETYNFFATMHGRDSLDNAGMPIVSTVHYGVNYLNAFWDGSRNQVAYGDGAGYPLADDVVAHELTHGVTQYTSGLFGYYQSGAINESFSDIWGEFVDQTNGRGTDTPAVKWLLGEDIAGLGAIRNLSDPTAFGHPDRIASPLYYTGAADIGGIHINSGVNNKAAFLMVDGGAFNGQTVAALGITKVAKIYYEVQTNLLTSGSDYADLYNALFQGCTNLIGTSGITAGDCQEVRDATNAVEMNLQPVANFNTDAAICPTGQVQAIVPFFDNLESLPANWSTNDFNRWFTGNFYAHSGDTALLGYDFPPNVSDSNVFMVNGVSLPPNAFLHFAHAYGFDASGGFNDGGVVEYSTNGGSSWNDAGPLFEVNGYDGAITSASNPLVGRPAFLDDSHGYISSRLNLSSLAGQNIRFRWRMGLDASFAELGWLIDDVRIYACAVPVGTVAVTPTTLNFAGTNTGGVLNPITPPQTVTVAFSGAGAATWSASVNQPWVQLTGASGTGSGTFTVGIINPGGILPTNQANLSATITLAAPVTNSPQTITVNLSLQPATTFTAPIGLVDTPLQNASGVVGAIAVTGWVVDDVGISSVQLYRNCLAFEPAINCQVINGQYVVFIGNATLVPGARPDIEALFPTYPSANVGGWGYLLLTSMLPHIPNGQLFGGQGPLTLSVFATDVEGHLKQLGRTQFDTTSTNITMDNDNITKPFGAIDTPGQGAAISGAAYANFGWALTPDSNTVADAGDILVPTNGSTMSVLIDGAPVGAVSYNQCRGTVLGPVPVGVFCDDDVSNIFGNPTPQPTFTPRTSNPTRHRNLDAGRGPIGAYILNTTTLSNGLHTIMWVVYDSAGRGEGIGSRFFTVLNGSSLTTGGDLSTAPTTTLGMADQLTAHPVDPGGMWARQDFNSPHEELLPDASGLRAARMPAQGRLEVALGEGIQTGYLVANGTLRALPPGSRLDPATGLFTWNPVLGYLGTYELTFLRENGTQVPLAVTLEPDGTAEGHVEMAIDRPDTGSTVNGAFTVEGWALDTAAWQGAGIGAVHVWAQRVDVPLSEPEFLGAGELNGARSDVGTAYGTQFERAGWALSVSGLAPGTYDVTAYVWRTSTRRFEDARFIRVTVR